MNKKIECYITRNYYELFNIAKKITKKHNLTQDLLHEVIIQLYDKDKIILTNYDDNSIKYIKSIKARSTEKEFDTNNVILVQQVKEGSFLKFNYLEQANEYDLIRDPLKVKDDEIKENLKREIINLNNQGKSYREIEELTGISKSKIGRIIQDYRIDDNILL